jgi:hypothetical protein
MYAQHESILVIVGYFDALNPRFAQKTGIIGNNIAP